MDVDGEDGNQERGREEQAEGEEPKEVQVGSRGGEPGRKEKEEGRKLRSIGDPRLPSQKEVGEHNFTHLPYRNWCPHCVRRRGKDWQQSQGVQF